MRKKLILSSSLIISILVVSSILIFNNSFNQYLNTITDSNNSEISEDKNNSFIIQKSTNNTSTEESKVISNNLDSEVKQDTHTTTPQCKRAGCNMELCVPYNSEITSSCANNPVYTCFNSTATCEAQLNGSCGWTYDQPAFSICTEEKSKPEVETETINVLEIRYIADPSHIPFEPDYLSAELIELLKDSSSFQKYKNPSAKNYLDVNIAHVININGPRPYSADIRESYDMKFEQLDLCTLINQYDIDHIWEWVDPTRDPAPGYEFTHSSKYFYGYMNPPFCNGDKGFVFYSFDYTRLPDLALHSFGHSMEFILEETQGYNMFWYNYTYNKNENLSDAKRRCGNVHFPPNTEDDYTYNSLDYATTDCMNWVPGTNQKEDTFNCTLWGCTQGGYLKWWFQNMPNKNNSFYYNGKKVPNWFDFVVDLDNKILEYYYDNDYHFVRSNFFNIP